MNWQQEWLGTSEWELAGRLHDLLCSRGHQMDQCWGLNDPYSLNQPEMTWDFRNWTSRALALIAMKGGLEEAIDYLAKPNDPRQQHPLWGPWTIPRETPTLKGNL